VPLHSLDGAVIGVGEATNKLGGSFTAEDAEILATLAARLADVLENSAVAAELKAQKNTDRANYPAAQFISGFSTQNIVGMSHRIESTIRLIDQIRPSSVDVLIQGESGTGKELIAKALHFNSPRAKYPFIAVNCAALPDALVEAELFGIEKGIATGVDRRIGKFEAAHEGTLFLDEIGDLSLTAQAKILRVLQERSVDRVGGRTPVPINVRIIAATNRNLEAAVREKQFRADLYYRLSVVNIQTPSLRETPEDIVILANHFLQKHCATMSVEPKQLSAAALDRLSAYPWPGNARQLENEIKRLVASVRGKIITEDQIAIPSETKPVPPTTHAAPITGKSLFEAVETLERRMIQDALNQAGGNKLKAAQVLGMSRGGFLKKLKKLTRAPEA
jgi:transcriptional regulator with PAS, ATPase and Fis domain